MLTKLSVLSLSHRCKVELFLREDDCAVKKTENGSCGREKDVLRLVRSVGGCISLISFNLFIFVFALTFAF